MLGVWRCGSSCTARCGCSRECCSLEGLGLLFCWHNLTARWQQSAACMGGGAWCVDHGYGHGWEWGAAMAMGMDGSGGQACALLSEDVKGTASLGSRLPRRQLVRSGDVFGNAGGVALWKQLHSALRLQQAML